MPRNTAPETAPELRAFKTPEQAAEYLPGITANWLRVAARRRDIPHQRVGGQRVIAFSDADIRAIQDSMAEPALADIAPRRRAR